ncbi:hypothetical protein AB1N83_011443 [Pleurotus pulmonarius]
MPRLICQRRRVVIEDPSFGDRLNAEGCSKFLMVPYARLVALFRLFQQTIWRNLPSVPAIISFVRRAFHFIWKRKWDLNGHGRAPNPLNLDTERDGGQPMIFVASQELSPGATTLSQDPAALNGIEHPDPLPVELTLHSSLDVNWDDAHASEKLSVAHSTSSNDAESVYVSLPSGSQSSLKPTPEGPPALSQETSNRGRVSTGTLARLSVEYPAFRPIVPTDIKRRERRRSRAAPQEKHHMILSPGVDRNTRMLTAAPGPPGWGRHTHPEGATFFSSEPKNNQAGVWVHTYSNLEIRETLDAITRFIQCFRAFVDTHGLHLDPIRTELVLELEEGSGNRHGYCDYYIGSVGPDTVFWFDEFKAANLEIWKAVPGATPTDAHIEQELECQGWYHYSLFPNARTLSQETIDYLRDMVIRAMYDVSMSEQSTGTVESTVDQLKAMLQAISAAETQVDKFAAGSVFVVEHSMHIRLRHKLMTSLFRGQEISRSSTAAKHSYTFALISPMLFYTPEFHLRILRGMYEDTLVYTSVAKQTLQTLNEEWQDFIINAAVLLNANIALLAIQSVDDSGTSATRSPIQIFSYVSMAMSTGSIVLGLLLVRQTRTKTPKRNATAMLAHSIQTRAILYSLPYAFLMWAMLTFGGAFASLCFIATNATTRAILAIICAAITILTVWCVVYTWEGESVPIERGTTDPRRTCLPTFRWRRRSTLEVGQVKPRPGLWTMSRAKGASADDFHLPVARPTAP